MIAVDATSQGQSAANQTSYSLSHTCSGSNRILFACVSVTAGDNISDVTYGGSAMTLIDKSVNTNAFTYLYYIIAPATGANNISVSKSTGAYIVIRGVSYTGAKQTGVPDAYTNNGSASTNSLTTSVTTVADNCWVILTAASQRNVSCSSGGTYRIGNANAQFQVFDTNGVKTPAGSVSMTIDETNGPQVLNIVMASFAPAVTASGNIKKINNIAWANVKKINGVAVANCKKINGVTAN